MPSKAHQMIIGLIGRKMRQKGYSIVALDGNEYLYDGKKLGIPITIKRHRPDIIGYNSKTKRLCIGEAKTGEDLFSKRTMEQLEDYSKIKQESINEFIEVLIGILKSSELDLIRILKKLSLYSRDNISYIWLPDELVNDD